MSHCLRPNCAPYRGAAQQENAQKKMFHIFFLLTFLDSTLVARASDCGIRGVLGGIYPFKSHIRARLLVLSNKPGGYGIGLALSGKIVEAHSGALTLQNRDGESGAKPA
jgi:signal transduction histidine kinase